jgi:hypothetical protein
MIKCPGLTCASIQVIVRHSSLAIHHKAGSNAHSIIRTHLSSSSQLIGLQKLATAVAFLAVPMCAHFP